MNLKQDKSSQGFSLLEMLVTLSLMTSLFLIALNNLNSLHDPLDNAASELLGFFKQVRARSISTTSSYLVTPISSNQLEVTYAKNCTETTRQADSRLDLTLPSQVSFYTTDWSICYSARGLPDDNLSVQIIKSDGSNATVEIFLGGGVRIT